MWLALLWGGRLMGSVEGRIVTGSTILNGEVTEHELCKFAYRIGKGSFKVNAWVEDKTYASRELTAYAYLDDNWDEVLKATTCEEKIKLARWSTPVEFSAKKFQKGRKTWQVPESGAKSQWEHKRSVSSSIRTHVWYFTLADCSLERFYHEVPAVHYRVELLDGDSHLPMDESGLKGLHACNVAAALALLVYVAEQGGAHKGASLLRLTLGGVNAARSPREPRTKDPQETRARTQGEERRP